MTSPVSYELQAKIAAWRIKAADDTLTPAEMREIILHLRAGRVAAAGAARGAASSRKKAAVAVPAADDMLSELEGF